MRDNRDMRDATEIRDALKAWEAGSEIDPIFTFIGSDRMDPTITLDDIEIIAYDNDYSPYACVAGGFNEGYMKGYFDAERTIKSKKTVR